MVHAPQGLAVMGTCRFPGHMGDAPGDRHYSPGVGYGRQSPFQGHLVGEKQPIKSVSDS